MVQYVPVTPGSGSNIAADDIGSVYFAKGKLVYGADGTANDVTLTVGLPVQPQTGSTWSVAIASGSVSITGGVVVTNAGTFLVQAAQSGTWAVTCNAGNNLNTSALALETGGNLAAINGKLPALGQALGAAAVPVVLTLAQMSTLTPPTSVGLLATATGGATMGQLISAATTNATSVKGSAGTLLSMNATNTNASWRYLKFYDKATAPTVGSDTVIQTIGIPPNSSGDVGIPACGFAFAAGIALSVTGALATADATAVTAGDLVLSYSFK